MLVLPSPEDAERLSADDDSRGRYLDRLVKIGGRCRHCGADVQDAMLVLHPEVCGARPCLRRARVEGFVSDLLEPRTVEVPHEPRPGEFQPSEILDRSGGCRGRLPEPEDDEPEPEPSDGGEDEDEEQAMGDRKLCPKCEKPLRADNRSGICTKCRIAGRKHRNGVEPRATARNDAEPRAPSGNGVHRPTQDEVVHGCDPRLLSDDDLAACIVEARSRIQARNRLAELLEAKE